jgi:predicted RNase H-like nuclease (RuvC/YqgF family)
VILKRRIAVLIIFLANIAIGIDGNAASVDDALSASDKKTAKAKASQQQIDKIADKTSELFQEFKLVNKEVEGLRVYNAQLEMQLNDQRETMAELEASIENAAVLERQIIPLTLKMIDSLEQFVNLDLPFLLEERRQRVARLRDNLNRADLSASEKFRQVLEAYKIESEYGTRIDSYTEMVDVGGQDREVNILRVGRVALMYQTTDQQKTAVWDQQAKQWQPLGDSRYRSAVTQGIRMARKQAAGDMLMLPISAPEAVQ